MRVTSKGQVTIPQNVRESMGILPSSNRYRIYAGRSGRWYIVKAKTVKTRASRFRTAHQVGTVTMSTDEIMALTRGESWLSS